MTNSTMIPLGWVAEPAGRGTWSILSSCVLTIFLCCWTSAYPNLPAKSDGFFKQWRHRLDLAFIGILGPEFLLMLALGQWTSARAALKKYHDAGHLEWTMMHAFFADMGGFLIESPDNETAPFPLDAAQLLALIEGGYVEYPDIEVEDIKDKSKSDGLARLITVAQASWFTFNCLIRVIQHLFLTTLELTTLTFIVVFFVTSFCWFNKPMNVNRPIMLKSTASISDIRRRYHPNPDTQWYQTPLDFLSRQEWFISRFWRYYTQMLHHLHIPLFTRPNARLYDRIPSDNYPIIDFWAEIICTPIIILFSCMLCFAWNYYFPSAAEKTLWRISSIYMLVYGVGGGLFSGYCHRFIFKDRLEREKLLPLFKEGPRTGRVGRRIVRRIEDLASKLRNIDPGRDPDLEIPVRILIPITILCMLYAICRGFVLAEDLVGLRDLPPTAFQTVSWSQYVPHL